MRAIGCPLVLAAVGAGAGLGLAAQEVSRHGYLGRGLWRTALWISARGVGVGAAVGAVCAVAGLLLLFFCLRLIAWRARQTEVAQDERRPKPFDCSTWALKLLLMLALATGATVLLTPRSGTLRLDLPYANLRLLLLIAVWAMSAVLAARVAVLVEEEQRAEAWFKVRWLTALCFAYVVVFIQTFTRAESWAVVAAISVAVAACFLAAYFLLVGPARLLYSRVGAPLGQALMGKPGRAAGVLLLCTTVVLLAASRPVALRARAAARQRGASVLVIAIDTLRADRPSWTSAEEHARDLTPNLRELVGQRGTVYSSAITQAPWTMPAVASVMTGLYPTEHGAEQRWGKLGASQLTLAEILRDRGYRTLGVSAAVYVSNASGLRQGFEAFDESQALGESHVSSPAVTDKAVEFLRAYGKEPFFLYAHYFDPHWKYRNHQEYDFADGYQGWLEQPPEGIAQNDLVHYLASMRRRPRRQLFDPEELTYLWDLYEEEIAFTDVEVGRLLRYVRESGLEETTLVVILADHGEEFMERGNLGHGKTVHEELIRVPLVIAEPSSTDQVTVSQPVETRALFTTILDFLEVRPPPGRDLPPSLLGGSAAERGPVRSATYTLISGEAGLSLPEPVNLWWTCIRDERWKLMKEHLRGRALLYDLADDSGETEECSSDNPEHRRRLERELDRLDARLQGKAPKGPVLEADEEQQRRLRALGYLGD